MHQKKLWLARLKFRNVHQRTLVSLLNRTSCHSGGSQSSTNSFTSDVLRASKIGAQYLETIACVNWIVSFPDPVRVWERDYELEGVALL